MSDDLRIFYTLRPAVWWSEYLRGSLPVEEVWVGNELIGAMYTWEGYRHGEVQEGDERYPVGDCVLETSGARDTMVGMIVRRRQVGNCEQWRSKVSRIEIPEAVLI